jgi:hypothetical protein
MMHRPHSRLAYHTPREVAATWKDHGDHLPRARDTIAVVGAGRGLVTTVRDRSGCARSKVSTDSGRGIVRASASPLKR